MDSFASIGEATGAEAEANVGSMLSYTPARDEASLWLGAAGDDGGGRSDDEGYLASLGSGGALMSVGGEWSISTSPGEEGLRWSGVKTEQQWNEWASGGAGKQQATVSELVMRSSPLLATAAAAAAAAADKGSNSGSGDAKLLAKADMEEGWKDFVGPPRASSSKLPSADGYSPSLFPPSSSSQKKPHAPAALKGLIKLPAALPATSGATHSASSSTEDNIAALVQQRSSPRAASSKSLTAAKPATAIATAATRTTQSRAAATATPPTRAAATKTRSAAAAAAAPPPPSATQAVTTRTRRSAAAAAVAAASAAVKEEITEDDRPADNDHDDDDNEDDDEEEEYVAGGRKKKTTTGAKKPRRASLDSYDEADPLDSDDPVGSELSDKRRRNREHAKRSRLRKRVRLGGLEEMVLGLRRENVRLRQMVMTGIPDRAAAIIRTCAKDNTNADVVSKQDVVQGMRPGMSVGSSSSSWSARGGTRKRPKVEGGSSGGGGGRKDHRVPSALKLMSPSYQTVKALVDSQANFILTNPNLPDCPIIFASQGFLELTGYEGKDVIGKNCRFLQGPGTDPTTLSIVRNNLAAGRDVSVCILNYKENGTPFWNQLSIGVLLDAHGQVANHVGVMCEVSQMPPAVFHRLLHRVPLPESLLHDDSGSESEGVDDHVERSGISAGSFKHSDDAKSATNLNSSRSRGSSVDNDGDDDDGSATARSSTGPHVVDRLRRTRAAAAASKK
eukprot:g5823.t1